MQTRHSIKDFCNNLAAHNQNLLDYLVTVRREKPIKQNYTQIVHTPQFKSFKQTFLRSKGTTLVPVKVDELFISTYEKISNSFEETITGVIDNLEVKIEEMKSLVNQKGCLFG